MRGLLFALLPVAAGVGLLAPLLTHVPDALQVAPVALLTEVLRQACFGLILGLAYPVLRARHRADQDRVPQPRAGWTWRKPSRAT